MGIMHTPIVELCSTILSLHIMMPYLVYHKFTMHCNYQYSSQVNVLDLNEPLKISNFEW